MAQYSNVSKPAFFIPFMDYQQSVGNIIYKNDSLNDIHLLNPTKTHKMYPEDNWWQTDEIQYDIDFRANASFNYNSIKDSDDYIYIFILGHNFGDDGVGSGTECSIEVQLNESGSFIQAAHRESIVNDSGAWAGTTDNGFSIIKAKFSVTTFQGIRIIIRGFSAASNEEIKIGSVSLCSKWTPPHSPDLNLKISREYDGVKTITTKGGATISNAQYTRGGTWWATGYPWELTNGDYDPSDTNIWVEVERTLGRRVWDLDFSFLADSDLMPSDESLTGKQNDASIDDDNDTIRYSQSFFARVLNRVQGSHLPFIFLPDDSTPNYNPDQWAICRFDQDSFEINQVANNVYDMSLKIRECW